MTEDFGPAVLRLTRFLPADKFPERVTRKADSLVVFEQTAPGRYAATIDTPNAVSE